MRAQYKFLFVLSLVFVFAGSIMISEQSWASRFDSSESVLGNLNVKMDFALEDRSEVRVAGGDFGDKRFKDKDFRKFFDDDRKFFDRDFKKPFFRKQFKRRFKRPFKRPFRKGFKFDRD